MQKISIKVYVITYAKSFEHLNSLGYLYYKLFFSKFVAEIIFVDCRKFCSNHVAI